MRRVWKAMSGFVRHEDDRQALLAIQALEDGHDLRAGARRAHPSARRRG